MKKAESTNQTCNKADEAALKIIHKLGLKHNRQISEEDLYTITKALYPKTYQIKLKALLNSNHMNAYYIVNLPK